MDLRDAQQKIKETYGHKDSSRGIDGTFMYLVEEIGELATALREGDQESKGGEFADVQAWLLSLASLVNIDMQAEFEKKYIVCTGCQQVPCICETKP